MVKGGQAMENPVACPPWFVGSTGGTPYKMRLA